jgi:predicted amidohydrolase YtcJ
VRVDAYLALNAPAPSGEHFGDWYTAYEPGPVADHLRMQGVKLTLDNGWGTQFWWEPDELRETIGRAGEAGWQVAVHTVSTEAHEMVLDAYESALAGRPNVLHHRIEHAIQATDEQLARMVALDLVTVIHPGAATDWLLEADFMGNLGEDMDWLARSKDFVDAGLHVAAASDAPWTFPLIDPPDPTGRELRDEVGRPVDLIASAMDAKGFSNPEVPAWLLDQRLTAHQGLAAVTIDAAYAIGDGQNRGHLAVGTHADITILSGGIEGSTPDEIRHLSVVATIVGGVTEYCAQPALCP